MRASERRLRTTMRGRGFARAALLAVLVAATGCGDDGDGGAFAVALTLRDGAGQAATTFALGAPITLELSVQNRSDRTRILTFGSSQTFEFQVFAQESEAPLWTWSRGGIFTPVIQSMSFEPGEVRTFTAVWDQVADDGAAVGAGTLEARGFLTVLVGPHVDLPENRHAAGVRRVAFATG